MTGFAKHRIDHSSASQVNMWADCPAAWVAKYLFGKKFTFGVAPQIGILTEDVVASVLMGASLDDEIEKAEAEFNRRNVMNASEKDCARVSNIRDMAEQALEVLKEYGEPEFVHTIDGRKQQRIELKCNGDGWELPLVGYLDFVYPKHGILIDLKTTLRCPSTMSDAHARQAAIYAQARGNMGVKFLYVTPKKSNMIDLEDKNYYLAQVKDILNRQEKLLRAFSKEELLKCVPISLSSFYWNQDIDIRKELFGV